MFPYLLGHPVFVLLVRSPLGTAAPSCKTLSIRAHHHLIDHDVRDSVRIWMVLPWYGWDSLIKIFNAMYGIHSFPQRKEDIKFFMNFSWASVAAHESTSFQRGICAVFCTIEHLDLSFVRIFLSLKAHGRSNSLNQMNAFPTFMLPHLSHIRSRMMWGWLPIVIHRSLFSLRCMSPRGRVEN